MKLTIENLTKKYGDFSALDGVSFECDHAEFFSVLGKSGSGKTTLIRIIAGLEQPDAGRILFDGKDVSKLPPHKRNAVMVFQNYALFPHLNVFENVAFGLRERRTPEDEIRKIVVQTLKTLGIDDKLYRGVSELSGGQQQRVAIARALAISADIVLFDEPLSNLDITLRREMQKELKSIQRLARRNFIYITHDQEEALMLSDRLMLMRDGKRSELGTPDDVYHKPQTFFGASFIGAANKLAMQRLDKFLLKTEKGLVLKNGEELVGKFFDVVIRPEHLIPVEKSGGENVFKATLKERYFKGGFCEFLLDVEGSELSMQSSEHFGAEGFVQIKQFFIFPHE
jgi:spermidine/putrescine transport system ATP-binding protein